MKAFLITWVIFFLFCLLLVPIAAALLTWAAATGFPGMAGLGAVVALIPTAILRASARREEQQKQLDKRLRDVEYGLQRLREKTGL